MEVIMVKLILMKYSFLPNQGLHAKLNLYILELYSLRYFKNTWIICVFYLKHIEHFSIHLLCRKHRQKIFYNKINHYILNTNQDLKAANTPSFMTTNNFWETPTEASFPWILLLFC